MKKKILCVVLSILLVFSMLPISTLAATVYGDTDVVDGQYVKFTYQNGQVSERALHFIVKVNGQVVQSNRDVPVVTSLFRYMNVGFTVKDSKQYSVDSIDTEGTYASASDMRIAADGTNYIPDDTTYTFRVADYDATITVNLVSRNSTSHTTGGNIINSVKVNSGTYTTNYQLFEGRNDVNINYNTVVRSSYEQSNYAKVKLFMRDQLDRGSSDPVQSAYAKNMADNANGSIVLDSDNYWFYVSAENRPQTGLSDVGINALKFGSSSTPTGPNPSIYNIYAYPVEIPLAEEELCTVKQQNVAVDSAHGHELRKVEVYVDGVKEDEISFGGGNQVYFPKRAAMAATDIVVTPAEELGNLEYKGVIVVPATKTYIINFATKEDVLAKAKQEAIQEIINAVGENPSEAVANIADAAIEEINKATKLEDVESAKNAGLLDIAKQQAKEAIDAAAGNDPSQAVKDIADPAKAAIDLDTTIEDVNAEKDAAILAIQKQRAIEEVYAYAEGKSDAVYLIAMDAELAIKGDLVDSKEKIDAIVERAKNDIDLQVKKEAAIAEVESAAGPKPREKAIQDIVDEATKQIKKATTPEAVDKAKNDALAQLNLTSAKQQAIAAINNAKGENPSDAVTSKANTAINNIENATTIEAVNAAKNAGLLDIAKQQANEAIDAIAATASKPVSKEVTDLVNTHKQNVANAATPEAANAAGVAGVAAVGLQILKEDAIKQVKESVGSDDNILVKIAEKEAIDEINKQTTPEGVAEALSKALGDISLTKAQVNAFKAIEEAAGPLLKRSKAVENEALKGEKGIFEAETIEDVETIAETTILNITKIQANEALDKAAGENPSTEVQNIVAKAKSDIVKANDVPEVKDILEKALLDIAKQQAKEEIKAAAGNDPSDEVEAIVEKYNKADDGLIDKAADTAAVTAAKEAALLEIAKQQAKEEIEEAAGKDPSDKVKKIVEDAEKDIDDKDVDTQEEIDAIVDQAKKDIALQQAKEAAEAAIDNAAGKDPSDEVEKIANKAKEDIEKATTTEQVDQIKEQALKDIALQQAKEEAIEEIEEAAGNDPSDEVKKIVEEAEKAIKEAQDEKTVDEIKEKALSDIALQQAKEEAIEEIEDEANKEGEETSEEIQEIVDEYEDKINEAENEEEVEKLKEEALEKIKEQYEDELKKYKEQGKKKLEDEAGEEISQAMQDILDEMFEEIDNAKTKKEVDDIVNRGIKKIEEQKAKEEAERKAKEALEEAKKKAIEELKKHDDGTDAAKKIIDDAIAKINAAQSIEEVNAILAAALDALKNLTPFTGDIAVAGLLAALTVASAGVIFVAYKKKVSAR